MTAKLSIFISYNSVDKKYAEMLRTALESIDLAVWLDKKELRAGKPFLEYIESGIRESRAVVVLLTPQSVHSEWVTYEFAFARGAEVPVMIVMIANTELPEPLATYHAIDYRSAKQVAREIKAALQEYTTGTYKRKAAQPRLLARFQEEEGEVCRSGQGSTPQLYMDLWIENAPTSTTSVAFEIPDLSFSDRKWTVRRNDKVMRPFLTEDFNSYGDVEVWAAGRTARGQDWMIKSTIYEALTNVYGGTKLSTDVRRAMAQIKKY